MFIVTNTIRVQKGSISTVVAKFQQHGPSNVAGIDGFLDLELWTTEKEDHDELVVVSKWTDKAAQKAWLKTDAFKRAHGRTPETRDEKPSKTGVILGNDVQEYERAELVQ